MEPLDPLSQLAACCFGRRQRSPGFKTQALRNQYYYSPSMAHIGPGNTTTWPMGAMVPFGSPPVSFIANQPPPNLAQPYILYTQPLIIADNQNAQAQAAQGGATMALVQHSKSPNGQMQTISFVGTQPSPIHKLQSLLGPSQYAIYSDSLALAGAPQGLPAQSYAPTRTSAAIYESPRTAANRLVRNQSNYLGPIAELSYLPGQQQQAPRKSFGPQQAPRSLNSEIYRRLELIEKQVDLTRDMDLVERHGIVITRAIEAHTLAPHLTDDTLLRYQRQFSLGDEYVIRFIEIVKRPGQTLGLYIRLVHFENQITKAMREGIVITKIESNSPVYTSQVLHVGDEILSINLIDIQSMSLDDVVTLMSIPKRLVLALRMPADRDPLLRPATFSLDHVMNNNEARLEGDQFQYSDARLRAQQVDSGAGSSRPVSLAHNFAPIPPRTTTQSMSQSNFWDLNGHRQESGAINVQSPLSRPSRVRSAIDMSDVVTFDDQGNIVEEPSTTMRESLSRQNQIQPSDLKALRRAVRETPLEAGPGNDGSHIHTPTSSTINQLERQMATTLSIDDQRDESDRFRNFSVDPEIATLEREAMNKERHSMHVVDAEATSHQLSNNDNLADGLNAELFTGFQSQEVGASPRRTLPTRPDLALDVEADYSSRPRRPVLSNIRLGETPEQSSYFSSSIDAINRELKELRQQRMAISHNDPIR